MDILFRRFATRLNSFSGVPASARARDGDMASHIERSGCACQAQPLATTRALVKYNEPSIVSLRLLCGSIHLFPAHLRGTLVALPACTPLPACMPVCVSKGERQRRRGVCVQG